MTKFMKNITALISEDFTTHKVELGDAPNINPKTDETGRLNPLKGEPQVLNNAADVYDPQDRIKIEPGERVILHNLFEQQLKDVDGIVLDVIADGVYIVYCPECNRKVRIVGFKDLTLKDKEQKIREQEATKEVSEEENYRVDENILNVDMEEDPNKDVGASGDSSEIAYIGQ